jgi:hypothetical protein
VTENRVEGAVGEAAHNDAFQMAARAGFAVSGLLHLVVGYIILRIAIGAGGTADQSGALATLADTGGAPVLWATAIGLAALGLWRLVETISGPHPEEKSPQQRRAASISDRAQSFALAVVYFAIAYSAMRYALGAGEDSAPRNSTLSAELMHSGWGKLLLVVIGVTVIAVGGYHVYKGAAKRFFDDLTVSGRLVTVLGVVGYVAKGLVLCGAGILLITATFTADPGKASGLDGAVKTLGAAPFGKVLLIIAGAGFAAFGLYSFARSRHCRL